MISIDNYRLHRTFIPRSHQSHKALMQGIEISADYAPFMAYMSRLLYIPDARDQSDNR